MNLHRRPLFLFVVAYLAGTICAAQSNLHPLAGLGIGASAFMLGRLLPSKLVPRPVIALAVAVFALGCIRTSIYCQVPAEDISRFAEGKQVYLTGKVASDPELVGNRVRFVLRTEKIRTYGGRYATSGRVVVTLYHSEGEDKAPGDVSFGEAVRIHGRLRKPLPQTNPLSFDYGEYLARQRIFCTLSAGTDSISVLQPAPWSFRAIALKFKKALIFKALALLPSTHAWLLIGILLGSYASLPDDIVGAFMRSGTMHLLAASGYNCGVLACIFGFLLIRLTSPRAVRHVLLIVLLWGFTLAAGAGPSIVRAAVMMSVFLLAYLLWRIPDMVNIVLFACLVILGVNPLSLYDIGFQLSFMAVLGIVLVMPLIEPRIRGWFVPSERTLSCPARWIRLAFRNIAVAVLLSVAAGLWTWPITAYYFNYVSIVSVIANALVALLVVLLTATGIVSLALGSVWFSLGCFAATITRGISGCILSIVTGLGSQPWSCLSVRSPSPAFIGLYYAILLGVMEYAYRKTSVKQRMADLS